MAKKKPAKQQQQPISPARFLKERVRQVPIYKCYLCEDLEKGTEGSVMIVRKHAGDKYTIGMYLIDKYCLGVKNAAYHLRLDESEFDGFMDQFMDRFNPRECRYEEAHNWVWGAVGFAEDAGIKPCKEFELAQYVLEEDDDNIELIEYDFGDEDGEHCLLANSRLEASTYLPLMHKNLGDKFSFCLGPQDSIHGPEDWDFEKNCPKFNDEGIYDDYEATMGDDEVIYHQVHPEYPKTLNLKNTDIAEVISCANPKLKTDEQIDEFLNREGLREDLEQYILYYIGKTNDTALEEDPSIYDKDEYYDINLMQAVRLLAEIGNEDSLKVLLEVLRQDAVFLDFHFSDSLMESCVPAIAKLGINHLDILLDYAKEAGLYDMAHHVVIEAVGHFYVKNEELRENAAEWFSELMSFFMEKMDNDDKSCCSTLLMSFFVSTLSGINCEELLTLIMKAYEKDYVNEEICGSYVHVSTSILTRHEMFLDYSTDIHEWFRWYHSMYEEK